MRFLCFHGLGTNAKFFERQTAKLRRALGTRHEFVFVDAPFIADPAPGTGIEVGTARRWSPESPAEYQVVYNELIQLISSCGPFGGVMGFSEGGAVAAGALIADSRLHIADFKCGIFLCAATPQDFDAAIAKGERRDMDPETDGIVISIPTAHIWSEEGPIHPGMGRGLLSLCKDDVRSEFVHGLGHDVPGARADEGFLGAVLAIERAVERAQG